VKETSWRIFRPKPSLDHLHRQARDLLRAARAGDTTTAGRIRAVADALTLASAQLAVARQAEASCEASIRDSTGRAARMLAAPEPARYSFATAVILGNAGCVRTELGRDPGLCTRIYVWTRAKGATGRSAY
jgi:hypothetical protein